MTDKKQTTITVSLIILIIALAAAGHTQGQDKTTTSPPLHQQAYTGVVLAVNDDAITSAQVLAPIQKQLAEMTEKLSKSNTGKIGINQFVTLAGPLVRDNIMAKVYNLLLYQYAKRAIDKSDSAEQMIEVITEQERKKLIKEYNGNEAFAQLELAKKGSSIENELDQIMRNLIISNYRDTNFNQSRVTTRREMYLYYMANKKEKYSQLPIIQFQLIDIQKNKPPNPGDAEKNAKAALKQIKAGADFAKVVEQYSHGFRKSQAGLWKPYNPSDIHPRYKAVVDALKNVKIGQCTGIIETDGKNTKQGPTFFIAKLIDYKKARVIPFSEAQFEIKETLLQRKWKKYSDKLSRKLLKTAIIGDLEQFVKNTVLLAYQQNTGKIPGDSSRPRPKPKP